MEKIVLLFPGIKRYKNPNVLKSILSITLLTILLLETDGVWLVYKIQQHYQQYKMLRDLNDKEKSFEQITLCMSDYQKAKINKHEISIEGKMYDVKSVSISGDQVTLTVIHDPDEEKIITKIKEVLSGRKQSKNNRPLQLRPIHTLKYISPAPEHNISFIFCSPVILPVPDSVLVTNDREIPTPPPKV